MGKTQEKLQGRISKRNSGRPSVQRGGIGIGKDGNNFTSKTHEAQNESSV
jgi:hypothetical protein